MLVKYKNYNEYLLSCGCTVTELIQARANTTICPGHGWRTFIIQVTDSYDNENR